LGVIVEDWGPREVVQGIGSNCQPDGTSAIWIRIKLTNDMRIERVRFGEYLWRPAGSDGPDVVTALVPACIIQRTGSHSLFVVGSKGETILIGQLRVKAA
jgi:hypothetical protein